MKAKVSDHYCPGCYCRNRLTVILSNGNTESDGDTVLCARCGFVGFIAIDEDCKVWIIERVCQ